MGLPALKIDHEPGHVRPHLRLVRPTGRSTAPRAKSNAQAAAHEAFVWFCVLIAVLALAALGRVWLSAEAAQATLQSSKLREQIKIVRFEGDMLEMQESRLGSASRIGQIATKSLGMAVAQKTAYIDLRPKHSAKARRAASAVPKRRSASAAPGVVDSVVDVAAGEARVLLVGDVGLASSR